VCAACPTPRFNPSSELEQHPRYVLHWIRNGYNNGVSSIHRNSRNSETNPTVICKMHHQYIFQDCTYWNLSRKFHNGNSPQLQGSYKIKFSYCNMHMNHHESISVTETYNVIKSQVTMNIWIILYYLPETLSASPSNWHNYPRFSQLTCRSVTYICVLSLAAQAGSISEIHEKQNIPA